MSLRYLGGYVSPSYNPLAANVGPGVNVAQTEGVYTTQAALESLSAGQWCTDPNFKQTTLLLQADNASNTSQNNTFLDSSINNFTITRSGNPTQGSFSPFSTQPGYWAGYFGGTGYYATTPFQSLPTTTSTFTIEAWIYQTAYPVAQGGPVQPSLVGDQNPTGAGANWMFGVLSTGLLSFWWNDTGPKACVGNTVTSLNTWTHVAVSVSANAIKLFVNGVLQTLTGNTTLGNRGADQARTTIGQYAGTNSYIYGYVSNLRIVTGTALYSTSFTPSTTPLTAISGTTLLTLQNSYTFKDASTNNRTITPTLASGQPSSLVTPQYAYSPAIATTNSVFFDGTGDYLTVPSNAVFQFGTGDFTIEAWIYNTSAGATDKRIFTNWGGGANAYQFYLRSNNRLTWQVYTSNSPDSATLDIPVNAWTHVAWSKSGSSAYLFINGVLKDTTGLTQSANGNGSNIAIGSDNAGGSYFFGNISNLRVVKGTAVYTTNFTPPTEPLTAIPGTSLLTCQAPTFIDSSTNNFTITVNGNSVVQALSPLPPYFPMGPNVTGGSGYFDGTGDYLTTSGSALDTGAGTADVTFECWVYNKGYSGSQYGRGIFTFFPTAGYANSRLMVRLNNGGDQINIFLYISGTIYINTTSTALAAANAWTHIAFVRQSGTFKLYINGNLDFSSTGITASFNTFDKFYIGSTQDGTVPDINGNISNFRYVKGTAVYTANFTPPTAPVTAVTNTALLTNFTNAGIVDNSLKTVAETVGNAQVSTSVTKFGSGSMAFDGTGDWLLLPDSIALQMGLGDFTVEGWVYLTATGTARGLVSKGTATTGWSVNITSTNFLQASYTSTNITGTIPLVANTWYHFAMVRLSSSVGNIKIYLNGVLAASSATAITTDFIQTNPLYVGANRVAGEPMLGYMDDVRITKMARYKDSFTPPTIAFARQ